MQTYRKNIIIDKLVPLVVRPYKVNLNTKIIFSNCLPVRAELLAKSLRQSLTIKCKGRWFTKSSSQPIFDETINLHASPQVFSAVYVTSHLGWTILAYLSKKFGTD